MSAPKSVVKIKKDGVEYVSNVDRGSYYLFELTRAALRDVGKFVKKRFKESYYSNFTRRTGAAGRVTKYKVWSSKSTKYPRLQIGLPTGRNDGFYAYFQEFGTVRTPELGLLKKTVEQNISEIVKIESQYLSAVSDERAAQSKINEGETVE